MIREDAKPEVYTLDRVAEAMREELQSSPEVNRLHEQGQALLHELLSSIVKNAHTVTQAKSVEDVPGAKAPKGLDRLKGEERRQAEHVVLQQVKRAGTKLYIEGLRHRVEQATKQGVPSDHPMVTSFEGAIKQIKGADQ
jgi:hypothetical protein